MKADGLKIRGLMAVIAVGMFCACWVVLAGGCNLVSGDYVKKISAAQPDVATAAMRKAAQEQNRKAIVPLVKRLYDEDPVIRLSAIRALKNITGEDMGYQSYEPEVKRIEAIKRWEAWLVEQNLTTVQQTPSAEDQQAEPTD